MAEFFETEAMKKYKEQEDPESIWYKPDKLFWQGPGYLMGNVYSCIKPRVSFIDFGKENKEELSMNLFGKFGIVKKDNGYVVKVEAEGEEKEVIADDYTDGMKLAINKLAFEIELKQRLEELEGQL